MQAEEMEILTVNEVANLLRVSPGTLSSWRSYGDGPAYLKLRGKVRYERSKVLRWAATAG